MRKRVFLTAVLGAAALLIFAEQPTFTTFPTRRHGGRRRRLIFVATSSDRKFRAYDQDNGKVILGIQPACGIRWHPGSV